MLMNKPSNSESNNEKSHLSNKRTIKQNNGLHLYCELVAQECNNSGVTFSDFIRLRPKLDMPWTQHRVKEIWREAQRLLYGKTRTRDLNKDEIDRVYDVVNKAIAEITGVHVPFPSLESLANAHQSRDDR